MQLEEEVKENMSTVDKASAQCKLQVNVTKFYGVGEEAKKSCLMLFVDVFSRSLPTFPGCSGWNSKD